MPCDIDNYMPATSHRTWMVRVSHPSSIDIPKRWAKECEFITWQLEDTGDNPHLQGYLVLKANPKNKNGRTLAWMKSNIDGHAHFEERRGTHDQAVAYCRKEESRVDGPWTIGKWSETEGPSRGGQAGGAVNASKILCIKRKIDAGIDEELLYEDHFSEMLRYSDAFNKYRMVKKGTHRNWYTKCLVFYGPPGTGKSTRAFEYAVSKYGKDVYYLNINKDHIWWDGYNGQKCVIVEEFFGGMPINYFNKMHDKFPFNIEIKGGTVPFLAELVIYTSNEAPIMWYGKGAAPGEPSKIPMEVLNAFQRRLSGQHGAVIEMKEPVVPTDGPDFKELFIGEEAELKSIAASQHILDLTASEDGDHRYRDEVGDDDAGAVGEEYPGSPVMDEPDDDRDEDDKTPPASQKRMFPDPLNVRSPSSGLTLARDEALPGRYKKPRKAGTVVQSRIMFPTGSKLLPTGSTLASQQL